MNVPKSHFAADNLARIEDETFITRVDFQREINSTNDRAMELAGSDDSEFPLLVLAESQTSGRGRGANRWWSGDGALTFSVLLATESAELPTERWPQVSLTVGLAVCEALEELIARGVPTAQLSTLPAVQLKWPNDVYIEGRKICGVLVEVPRNCAGRLLLGIGVNVNNSLVEAPEELRERATSLVDLTGRQFPLADVLIEVLQCLAARLEPDELWNAEVQAGWRRRCLLTGQRLQVDLGVRRVVGTCRGIDDDGALLVEVDGKTERHLAGTVTLLRE